MVEIWDPKEACIPEVEKWFLRNPKHLIPTDATPIQFLHQKSIAVAQLADSSSKSDFIQ